jgi:hypothetical protein
VEEVKGGSVRCRPSPPVRRERHTIALPVAQFCYPFNGYRNSFAVVCLLHVAIG